jgi:hypothetical protein
LLHAEQGLGDTLHFIRYAQAAKARGGTVLLECAPSLHALLSRVPGLDGLVAANGRLPRFDVHAPLLSLPWILGQFQPEADQAPYLRADDAVVEQWRDRLEAIDGFRVGINWQGNPEHPRDRLRSAPLRHFLPLADAPSVRLVSLQKGHGSEQLAELAEDERRRIVDLGTRLDNSGCAFVETAAVLAQLDLVITTDTALAHLAGGMGVPTWLVLCASPDWRWQLGREDTPWYPAMRLFRQPRPGDWASVFAKAGEKLRKQIAS